MSVAGQHYDISESTVIREIDYRLYNPAHGGDSAMHWRGILVGKFAYVNVTKRI